jgi:small subunit ribosomal protein S20
MIIGNNFSPDNFRIKKLMDRHPQQIKRTRQDKKRNIANQNNRSKMRTLVKNLMATKKQDEAGILYKDAVSFIDKMTQKGLIHRNTAARKKAQITLYFNSLSKS